MDTPSTPLRRFFKAQDQEEQNIINGYIIINRLRNSGLRDDDPRLKPIHGALNAINQCYKPVDLDSYLELTKPARGLLERVFCDDLVIPEFNSFCDIITEIYNEVKDIKGGMVASYIPQLEKVNPDHFAVSICTVDGQRFSIGDTDMPFCLQSASKPLTYCLALEENGDEIVHHHVGREPSGVAFNSLCLNTSGLPHNPMINSGAIMACSLIKETLPLYARFDYIISQISRLCGGKKPGFNNSVYVSEKQTADANYCLAYMMRQAKAFKKTTNLEDTLDLYFQCCSVELNADDLAVIAATFASGGVCPLTNDRIFSPDTCRNSLSLMYSCGMYDYSGEWAFTIGVPAKSGVSGTIYAVVPGLCGICVWSPPLDHIGNSFRGVEFFKRLVKRFKFHTFGDLGGVPLDPKRIDPRKKSGQSQREKELGAFYACAEGDAMELRRLYTAGININAADYDKRTFLHVAASEGHYEIVKLLLRWGAAVNSTDRWGRTPLMDALRESHERVADLLRQNGGIGPDICAGQDATSTTSCNKPDHLTIV
jgi:glutaminase